MAFALLRFDWILAVKSILWAPPWQEFISRRISAYEIIDRRQRLRYLPWIGSPTLEEMYFLEEAPVDSGTFAKVYRCSHRETGQLRAAKRYDPQCCHGINEMEVLKMLDHPNIVRFHESFHSDSSLWVITDFLEGSDLGTRLCFPIPDVNQLFQQMLAAIQHLHGKGLLHRDLKPENFILSADSTHLTMIDLGFSSPIGDRSRHGSRVYAAPELFREDGVATEATDVWALGIILYLMKTGAFPWSAHDEDQFVLLMRSGAIQSRVDRNLRILAKEDPSGAAILGAMLKFEARDRISINSLLAYRDRRPPLHRY